MKNGNGNVLHTVRILSAEQQTLLRGINKLGVTERMFDELIASAVRVGFDSHAAIACEGGGGCVLEMNPVRVGYCIGRAYELYREWGALGKTNLLDATLSNSETKSSSKGGRYGQELLRKDRLRTTQAVQHFRSDSRIA